MRPTRPILLSLLLTLGIAPAACSRQSESPTATEAAQASASRDGADLVATADRTSLRTVDRLTLMVRATAPEGMVVRDVTLDAEGAGWTVVDRPVPATSLNATGQAVRTDTLVLEPFLDGEYVIPPITASFAAPGAPGSLDLTTTPIAIAVESVLPEDAALEDLAAPTGPVDPPAPEPRTTSPWLIGAVTAAAVGVLAVLVVLVRSRSGREPAPDFERELHLLRAHPTDDPETDRDRLAALLWRASLSRPSPELTDLLGQINAERYAPRERRPVTSIADEIDTAIRALRSAATGGTA